MNDIGKEMNNFMISNVKLILDALIKVNAYQEADYVSYSSVQDDCVGLLVLIIIYPITIIYIIVQDL